MAVREPKSSSRHSSTFYETLIPYRTSVYATLADALRHSQLLTAKEKANGHRDAVKEHLLGSRSYHGLLWTLLIGVFFLGVVFIVIGIMIGLDNKYNTAIIIPWIIAGWFFWFIFWMMVMLPCSRKLR